MSVLSVGVFRSFRPEGLTPGDFAVVRRKAELLDEARPLVLAGWLAEERAVRDGGRAPIGFRSASDGPVSPETGVREAA